MAAAIEIETSPRSTRVHRDHQSVDVVIWRGRGDPDWVLEIVDQAGDATIWRRPFVTDDAAFAMALRTIAEEGIDVFAPASSATDLAGGGPLHGKARR